MNVRDCAPHVSEAAGRQLSSEELDQIFNELGARTRRRMAAGEDIAGAARAAAEQLAAETRLAATLEKRNRLINEQRRIDLDGRVTEGKEAESARALLTGVQRNRRDAANSIDANRHAVFAQIHGPMIAELRQAGLLKALRQRDKAFERDIARELWRLDDPESTPFSGNQHAREAAAILNKYQELTRLQQNEAGAWIGKQDHYITRQSHDMDKIRGDGSEAAFGRWQSEILPRLDPRTFDHLKGPAEIRDFMRQTWLSLSSGVHETANASEWLSGFKGGGNIAKRASAQRVLHFLSADDWFDYNAQYGKHNVLDSIVHGLERGARNTAVMRTLGTNPEAMFTSWVDRMVDSAKQRGDFKQVDRLRGDANGKILDVVTGKAGIAGHTTIGAIGSTLRNVQSLAKLGGVVLSSIPDIAVAAATLRHNGVPLFEAYSRQFAALLPGESAARRGVADHLGVGLDGIMGAIVNRFRAEDGHIGQMSKTVDFFHRINLLTWWTDAMKEGVGTTLSYNLAKNAAKGFAELPALMQTSLRRYGIEAGEWEGVRAVNQTAADGRNYILPSSIDDVALSARLQTYITDQVREAMSEPTAGIRNAVTFGTQAGTVAGEAVRLLMQFKTYPVTFLTRSLGREIGRDGVDVAGVAHLIVATTLLGYAAMTAKELAKGRNPRSPETPGDVAKLVTAAMVQGGGAGIYGDFLFGQYSRTGGGFVGSLMGPTAGTVNDLQQLLTSLRTGEGHPGDQAFQLAMNNAPLINVFYARAALDHLVLFRLQEAMNPGYLQRYERRIKQQNNQTFWLKPSASLGINR